MLEAPSSDHIVLFFIKLSWLEISKYLKYLYVSYKQSPTKLPETIEFIEVESLKNMFNSVSNRFYENILIKKINAIHVQVILSSLNFKRVIQTGLKIELHLTLCR